MGETLKRTAQRVALEELNARVAFKRNFWGFWNIERAADLEIPYLQYS